MFKPPDLFSLTQMPYEAMATVCRPPLRNSKQPLETRLPCLVGRPRASDGFHGDHGAQVHTLNEAGWPASNSDQRLWNVPGRPPCQRATHEILTGGLLANKCLLQETNTQLHQELCVPGPVPSSFHTLFHFTIKYLRKVNSNSNPICR